MHKRICSTQNKKSKAANMQRLLQTKVNINQNQKLLVPRQAREAFMRLAGLK